MHDLVKVLSLDPNSFMTSILIIKENLATETWMHRENTWEEESKVDRNVPTSQEIILLKP